MVRLKQRYLLLNILYPSTTISLKQDSKSSDLNFAPLAFQSPTPDYVDATLLVRHLKTHIETLYGDYGIGVASSSLKIVYFSAATSTAILRVPRNHHQLVRTALTHITELPVSRRGTPGKHCVIRVVRVSGTIRKAEEELLRRARQDVVRAKTVEGGGAGSWLPSVGNASRKPAANSEIDDHIDVLMHSIEDLSGSEEDESE